MIKKDQDDSIIDLSGLGEDERKKSITGNFSEEPEFEIGSLDPDVVGMVERVSEYEYKDADAQPEEFSTLKQKFSNKKSGFETVPSTEGGGPSDRVKVKFDKFITLVATHTYEDILKKNADEDVIISTDLLTDLANAHEEEKSSKKLPFLFAVGIILGVVITWLVMRG